MFAGTRLRLVLRGDERIWIIGQQRTVDYTQVEYGSGWYLRGDIGYNLKASTTLSYYSDDRYDYDNQSFSSGMNWALGGGYTFNDMLRADITADYGGNHSWEGHQSARYVAASHRVNVIRKMKPQWTARLFWPVPMCRFGSYGGFSPYVGGGIGLSPCAMG